MSIPGATGRGRRHVAGRLGARGASSRFEDLDEGPGRAGHPLTTGSSIPWLRPARLGRLGRLAPTGPYAVVDVETTGLDPAVDRIVEVAVVRCDERGTVTSEWSSLVQPDRDPGPTAIHGITDADLHAAPRFDEVLPALAEQLVGAVVTAHNLAFDAAFLAAEWERAGRPRPPGTGLCTLDLARSLYPRHVGYSLAALTAGVGIAHPDAHRALPDAQVTAGLLAIMLGRIPTGRRPWPRRRLRLR